MKVHFTNLFGQASTSVALMAQNNVMKIVRDFGVNELGIYFYDASHEPWEELNSRMDGIVAGVSYGDVVFFQSPSWNSVEWDNHLVEKLKLSHVKMVMFIHDVQPLMFESNYYLMKAHIDMYNKCDVVIVPSEQMYQKLVSEGLTVKNYVVQKLWDLPHGLELYTPKFEKKLIFSGDPSRFPHIVDWKHSTPLHVYATRAEGVDYSKVHLEGWRTQQELLLELSKGGGFGLVWGNSENPTEERDYYKENVSYKLTTYLAAGIPVVVPDYLSNADYIREKGLGFVVSSLEEASRVVQECTAEEYDQMVTRAKYTAYLIKNGYFTKKLFIDSMMLLD